jgi:hypothetical protein
LKDLNSKSLPLPYIKKGRSLSQILNHLCQIYSSIHIFYQKSFYRNIFLWAGSELGRSTGTGGRFNRSGSGGRRVARSPVSGRPGRLWRPPGRPGPRGGYKRPRPAVKQTLFLFFHSSSRCRPHCAPRRFWSSTVVFAWGEEDSSLPPPLSLLLLEFFETPARFNGKLDSNSGFPDLLL